MALNCELKSLYSHAITVRHQALIKKKKIDKKVYKINANKQIIQNDIPMILGCFVTHLID